MRLCLSSTVGRFRFDERSMGSGWVPVAVDHQGVVGDGAGGGGAARYGGVVVGWFGAGEWE